MIPLQLYGHVRGPAGCMGQTVEDCGTHSPQASLRWIRSYVRWAGECLLRGFLCPVATNGTKSIMNNKDSSHPQSTRWSLLILPVILWGRRCSQFHCVAGQASFEELKDFAHGPQPEPAEWALHDAGQTSKPTDLSQYASRLLWILTNKLVTKNMRKKKKTIEPQIRPDT